MTIDVPEWAAETAHALPYPLIFATVSGAHLYGFASVDSDLDVRAAHLLPAAEVLGLRSGPCRAGGGAGFIAAPRGGFRVGRRGPARPRGPHPPVHRGRTGMTLRTAVPGDFDAVLALAVDFYAEDGFATPRSRLAAHLEHLLGSDAAHVAVIASGGAVVAFAISTSSYGLENGLIAELEDLYVAPDFRRRGLAASLIEDSAAWATGIGAAQLELVVAPNGTDASHLFRYYRADGFVDEGRQLLARPLSDPTT
ncbi:GNAT family N-acetyltransferase [Paractinoplanes durhamensis]|uniref:N-acetyltransferase domain-containing protein n=1 Tax=Paractinoplanes durhamensis TaxID=113563 RepID=A0ABQ3YQP3_9ACTN|nr:GNAT family N-acetyltransferase [Actinoplanes durhamensis]GID99856.1 hypothetical protein Adu01nite_12070 [Actinoplanes durhamensis]